MKYPDIIEHNNPNNPLMDINQLKGITNINLLVERDTIPLAKRRLEHFVVCRATGISYIYIGTTIDDIDWNNSANWVSGGGITTLPASQISVIPTTEFTSTDQQSYNDENAARIVAAESNITDHEDWLGAVDTVLGQHDTLISKLDSDQTPSAIADTDNVRFKSATGYYNRTLLAIKNYVLNGLSTLNIINASALFGTTLNDVLDVADAIKKSSIQDGDALALSRMNGSVAENIFVLAENAKDYFGGAGGGVIFVKDAAELGAALITESASVDIFVTAPITGVTFSNITPTIINIKGAKLSTATTVIPNSTVSTDSKLFIENEVYIGSTEPRISALTNTFSFYFRNLKADYPILLSGISGGILNVFTDNSPVMTVEVGTVNIVTENNFFEKSCVYLDGSNIPDAPQYPTGTKLLMQNTTGVELVPITTIGAAVTAGYVRKDGANISSVYGALNLNSLVLFKEVGESIGTATVSDLKTALSLPDSGFLYNTVVTNANETVYFTCTKGGDFSVKCRFKCSNALNRTITLIPVLPVTLCIDSIFETLISNGGGYIYGTEEFNKVEFDAWHLVISSSLDTLDDKIEWRNTRGNASAYYTEVIGVVDLTSSGLTLALSYTGDAVEHVKEITIKGSLNQKS